MIENLKDEVWMTHPIYTDYAASNYGRIKHLERDTVCSNGVIKHYEEELINPSLNKYGYLQFNIKKHSKVIDQPKAHRFVYECLNQVILPKGGKELQINHIDENKQNNKICNICMATPKENSNWGTRNERIAETQINDPKKSKKVAQFSVDGNLVKVWESIRECGRNGFARVYISQCCNNKYIREGNNIYKGFIWKFI